MTTKEKNKPEAFNDQKITVSSKKRGFPFWAVFCISAWMFFIGVLVGRGNSPVTFDINALEKQIAELKKSALIPMEVEASGADPTFHSITSEFEFYEELKKADKNPPVPVIESRSKTVVRAGQLKDAPTTESSSSFSTPAATSTPPTISTPDSDKNTEKNNKYYSIQVASLKNLEDADKQVEILKNKGYPAYRISAQIRDTGTWHRVRIGPFKNQSEALRILVTVSQKNKGALLLKHDS
jgi:cell division septation protein DedD